MAYFSHFPKIFYKLQENREIVTDILRNVAWRQGAKNISQLYYQYSVKDGERPEDIAHRLYKDPTLHWLIILMNDIINPYYDWSMTYDQIRDNLIIGHGDAQQASASIHHYEDENGYWIPNDADLREGNIETNPIYELDYHIQEELTKRSIKLLKPENVPQVLSEFKRHMDQQP